MAEIQFKPAREGAFKTIKRVPLTDAYGYFDTLGHVPVERDGPDSAGPIRTVPRIHSRRSRSRFARVLPAAAGQRARLPTPGRAQLPLTRSVVFCNALRHSSLPDPRRAARRGRGVAGADAGERVGQPQSAPDVPGRHPAARRSRADAAADPRPRWPRRPRVDPLEHRRAVRAPGRLQRHRSRGVLRLERLRRDRQGRPAGRDRDRLLDRRPRPAVGHRPRQPPPGGNGAWKPSAAAFKQFVQAAGDALQRHLRPDAGQVGAE